jgi:hypothetical protein
VLHFVLLDRIHEACFTWIRCPELSETDVDTAGDDVLGNASLFEYDIYIIFCCFRWKWILQSQVGGNGDRMMRLKGS